MKTKEELNALKEEVEVLKKKLAELTEEELDQVSGGVSSDILGCGPVLPPGAPDAEPPRTSQTNSNDTTGTSFKRASFS